MSNTVIAVVGGPCVGKSRLIKFIESKFKGRLQADLVCVYKENSETSTDILKRNAAEEEKSAMYSFLVHMLQTSMQSYSSSFSSLKPRQFLIIENSVEFVDLLIHAAKDADLISTEQWTWLRTLADEFMEFSAIDMFIVINSDEFPACENFHKGPKSTKVHKENESVIMKWSLSISALLPEWVARQKARRKLIFELSPRTSKFTILSKSKQLLNAAFSLANSKLGTGFPKMASPLDRPDRVEAALQSWVKSHGRSVSFLTPGNQLSTMPPKKKPSETASATLLADMDIPLVRQEARRLSAQVRQNLANPHQPGEFLPGPSDREYPVQSVAQYQVADRAQVPPVGRSTPLQGHLSSSSAPPVLRSNVNSPLDLDSVFGTEERSSPSLLKRAASEQKSSSDSGEINTNSSDSSDTAEAKNIKKKKRRAKKSRRSESPMGTGRGASLVEQACHEARLVKQVMEGVNVPNLSPSSQGPSGGFPSPQTSHRSVSPPRPSGSQSRVAAFEEGYEEDLGLVRQPGRPAEYGRDDGRSRYEESQRTFQEGDSQGRHTSQRSFSMEDERSVVPHPRATVAPFQRSPQSETVAYVPGDSLQPSGRGQRQEFPPQVRLGGDASRSRDQIMWEEDARDAMAIRRYRQERRFRREQLWRRMHAESGNRFPDWDDEMDGKF